MIDTLKLRSPAIVSDITLTEVKGRLDELYRVGVSTGEVVYRIIAGSLAGSFDHSISMRLDELDRTMTVEGSVHKAMLGHNVYGGPIDERAACRWFVWFVEQLIEKPLPDADGWEVRRLDRAENFIMPGSFAAYQFMLRLTACRYPRRKTLIRVGESITFVGSGSAVKVYYKGPEFVTHDRKRVSRHVGLEKLEELQDKADRTIRFEVEFRSRKLKDMNGGEVPLVGRIDLLDFDAVMDAEAYKLMREGKDTINTVRRSQDVIERLKTIYGGRHALVLHGIWASFAIGQEEMVRSSLKKATFYRYRKQLIDAGVSWIGTDVVQDPEGVVPSDFSLALDSPYRSLEVDPIVADWEAIWKVAA